MELRLPQGVANGETVHATYNDSLGVTNWESAHVTFDRDGRVPYIEGQSIEVIAPGPDNWDSQRFFLFKILRAHVLPLTNCPYTPPTSCPSSRARTTAPAAWGTRSRARSG